MLNVATGNISPQYHVVFDDLFETVDTTFQDPALALDHTFDGPSWSCFVLAVTKETIVCGMAKTRVLIIGTLRLLGVHRSAASMASILRHSITVVSRGYSSTTGDQ